MISQLKRTHNDTNGIADPVYIALYTPHGYFMHFIDGLCCFCSGKAGAQIWAREAAIEFAYRNQVRNFFLESAVVTD